MNPCHPDRLVGKKKQAPCDESGPSHFMTTQAEVCWAAGENAHWRVLSLWLTCLLQWAFLLRPHPRAFCSSNYWSLSHSLSLPVLSDFFICTLFLPHQHILALLPLSPLSSSFPSLPASHPSNGLCFPLPFALVLHPPCSFFFLISILSASLPALGLPIY